MIIAITSQNRKHITAHAGKCRRFWLYKVENGSILQQGLLELTIDETFSKAKDTLVKLNALLGKVDVFVSAGMGEGLEGRLAKAGVKVIINNEQTPDEAALALAS